MSTAPPTAFPLLERPGPAVLLAVVSGLLNAWTYAHTQTFATVQSGNIVSVGYFAASGQGTRALVALASIAAFLAGAFGCSLLVLWRSRHGRGYSTVVLTIEGTILVALIVLSLGPGVDPWWIAWTVSFLAGAQGNAFHRETGMLYGNVAVTLVLQMAGSLLGRAVGRRIASDGQAHLRPALGFLLVLVGFTAGGGVGFLLDGVWSAASLALAAVGLVALAFIAARSSGPVDPAQNAPTP